MDKRFINVPTGQHGEGAILRITRFTSHLVCMSLVGHTERTQTVLLNRDEATALCAALGEFIPELEPEHPKSDREARHGESARPG